MVYTNKLTSASLYFTDRDTSLTFKSSFIILLAYNCTRGERRVLIVPDRGWSLWGKKEKGKSLFLSQAVLFTSHDLSLPLNLYIIFRTCFVMVVGFIL